MRLVEEASVETFLGTERSWEKVKLALTGSTSFIPGLGIGISRGEQPSLLLFWMRCAQ